MKKQLSKILLILIASLLFAGCGRITEIKQIAKEIAQEGAAVAEILETAADTEPTTKAVSETTESNEASSKTTTETSKADSTALSVEEGGEYSDKEHVALYLYTFGHLPSNFVTKNEAKNAGWDSSAGNLIEVLPGKSIGGDRFGNYEGLLPEAQGRQYYECDINYNPKGKTSGKVTRGPERIVFSNDGLIFYTADHYESFEQLY